MARRRRRCATINQSLTIRAGGPADRAFVLDLGGRTSLDSVSSLRAGDPATVRRSYERLVEFVESSSEQLTLIAEASGERLGFLLLLFDVPDEVTQSPQAFVAYMAVEPAARRRGIAARLLAEAERAARERGFPALALMVTEDNEAARELYAQAGFLTERRLLCKML